MNESRVPMHRRHSSVNTHTHTHTRSLHAAYSMVSAPIYTVEPFTPCQLTTARCTGTIHGQIQLATTTDRLPSPPHTAIFRSSYSHFCTLLILLCSTVPQHGLVDCATSLKAFVDSRHRPRFSASSGGSV